MKETTTIQADIDADTLKSAEEILKDIGLSLDDAIQMFLLRIITDNGLPFQPKPNKETEAALKAALAGEHSRPFSSVEELIADLKEESDGDSLCAIA